MAENNQDIGVKAEIEEKSFIFIPDISGFTRFVNETEIDHSQHIIKELLEIIIDANQLGLKVSEVEGDAVLFYKLHNVPTVQAVIEQSKQMFLHFHRHLQLYERDRICECGACSTAHRLSLKVFAHAGDIRELQVKNHEKLMGTDLILAHRLMKNSVDSNEYVLFSEDFFRHNPSEASASGDLIWMKGSDDYDGLGNVPYRFASLSGLHDEIGTLPPRASYEQTPDPISFEFLVNAPLSLLHRILTEIDYKPLISKGDVSVEYDRDLIPRVGTLHQCKLPSGYLEIRAIENQVNEDERIFAERIENFPVFKKANVLYTMKKKTDEQTSFVIDFHYSRPGILQKLIALFMRPIIRKQFRKGLKDLVNFAENAHSGKVILEH